MVSISPGSEECPFPYPPDDSRDCSPDSPVTTRLKPRKVNSYTQTEGPQLSSATVEAFRIQPSLLIPALPAPPFCPSPVPQRKQRHCAKWENRASILQKPKEQEEDSKASYESLESVSIWTSTVHNTALKCTTSSVQSRKSNVSFSGQPEAPKS